MQVERKHDRSVVMNRNLDSRMVTKFPAWFADGNEAVVHCAISAEITEQNANQAKFAKHKKGTEGKAKRETMKITMNHADEMDAAVNAKKNSACQCNVSTDRRFSPASHDVVCTSDISSGAASPAPSMNLAAASGPVESLTHISQATLASAVDSSPDTILISLPTTANKADVVAMRSTEVAADLKKAHAADVASGSTKLDVAVGKPLLRPLPAALATSFESGSPASQAVVYTSDLSSGAASLAVPSMNLAAASGPVESLPHISQAKLASAVDSSPDTILISLPTTANQADAVAMSSTEVAADLKKVHAADVASGSTKLDVAVGKPLLRPLPAALATSFESGSPASQAVVYTSDISSGAASLAVPSMNLAAASGPVESLPHISQATLASAVDSSPDTILISLPTTANKADAVAMRSTEVAADLKKAHAADVASGSTKLYVAVGRPLLRPLPAALATSFESGSGGSMMAPAVGKRSLTFDYSGVSTKVAESMEITATRKVTMSTEGDAKWTEGVLALSDSCALGPGLMPKMAPAAKVMNIF
jgi:predicted secreted protein